MTTVVHTHTEVLGPHHLSDVEVAAEAGVGHYDQRLTDDFQFENETQWRTCIASSARDSFSAYSFSSLSTRASSFQIEPCPAIT